MKRYRPTECILCEAPIVQRGNRTRRFCSAAHRVAFHRLKKRGGTVLQWRREHGPPAPSEEECRAQLTALVEAWERMEPLGRVGQSLRTIAQRAQDLLIQLEDAEPLVGALEYRYVDHGLWRPLDDLRGYREILERLAGIDDLVEDIHRISAAVRALHRDAETLREALDNAE